MSTIDIIARTKPSENSGAMAANRFAYQINWGLKKLLELESKNEDYIMVLDYHDDIVVCNSEKNEDYIDFYQIKTSSIGNWNLKAICGKQKQKKSENKEDEGQITVSTNANLSFVAKLILHTRKFQDSRKLYFVTNSRLSNKIYGKGDEFVEFEKLDKEVQIKIKENVKEEIGEVEDEIFNKLAFVQNQMSVNDYEDTMRGALARFLSDQYKTFTDVSEVYYNIISMMNSKTKHEASDYTTDDLLKYKSISHEKFRNYLEEVAILPTFKGIIQKLLAEIKDDVTFKESRSLKQVFDEIQTDILNYENNEMQTLIPLIRTTMRSVDVEDANCLWEYTNLIYDKVVQNYENYMNHSDIYIKAVILYVTEKY